MVDHDNDPHAVTQTGDTLAERGRISEVTLPPPGYDIGELIGRGGMGEVMQAYDQRIGREVAIKRMRGARPSDEQITRFLREARIQARLDHPAIVPVYELGTDAHGQPYFTMKRLAGVTLAQRLVDGGPLQPLLRALVDVCLAVELAHARGIVHRDLKPANIMLGDYGEVYVLDWGVARVLTDDRRAPSHAEIDTLGEGTQTGAMLGTPGYMAPEQIKGIPATQGADVYALGAILFEILAGEPLHPRGNPAIASTLTNPQDAPARRRADRAIAPELDAACLAALAEEPEQRPTARQLADQIQAYLDGDRDLDRRRRLAVEQLAGAREALASSDAEARATAVRRAGRALALDPDSAEAADLVTNLIVEPPKEYPLDLVESLREQDRQGARVRAKKAVRGMLSTFVLIPFFPLLDVLSWPWLITLYASILVVMAVMVRASRTGDTNIKLALVLSLGLLVAWSRIASPYMMSPLFLCGGLMAFATNSWVNRRPLVLTTWGVTAIALPILLEWTGVLEPTLRVYPDYIWAHSVVFRAGRLGDVLLLGGNVVLTAIVGLLALAIHRNARDAQRQLYIQAWHLRHLIPTAPRAWDTRSQREA